MAEPQHALVNLADIVEPPLPTGIELAPGWWILLVTIILLFVLSAIWLLRRKRFYQPLRQAQSLLRQYSSEETIHAAQINQLLKRVLKHYQPGHPALASSVNTWQQWLQSTLPTIPLPDLNHLLYKDNPAQDDVSQFYRFAAQWLKQYKGDARPLETNGGTDA